MVSFELVPKRTHSPPRAFPLQLSIIILTFANTWQESYVSSCGMTRQQPIYTCGSDITTLYVVEDDCNDACSPNSCTDQDSAVAGGLIFDDLNVDQTSCGLTQGQDVWLGCSYVYAIEGECTKECGDGCSTPSTLYFKSWLPASYENQIFHIPSKWSAVDQEPLFDSARPIPSGLW